MLQNIHSIDELKGLARARVKPYITKTVAQSMVEPMKQDGYDVQKTNSSTVRLIKQKPHGTFFEDRVWVLLFRMGFAYLSGEGGAKLVIDPKNSASPVTQIDAVAIDDEVAIAIECKSSEVATKARPQFQEDLGKFALIRERFANSANQQFASTAKKQSALIMFHSRIGLSENDRARAVAAGVTLLDDRDLEYYEGLVAHLGIAARYQFLADILTGKTVAGLTIKIPAVRSKMGGVNCYTFSVSPAYLLKIAYVSHRKKGKASDVNTYQRMIKRPRLNKIREYIEKDGIFPTNIVINLDRAPRFDVGEQAGDQQGGKFGWLELKATYKSAWIIDGQHRLFAYSGLKKAETSKLAVLAFEKLSPSRQAQLFIDINAQQKSVKQSLLQELYAELHWDAEDPLLRTQAIVSKAIQTMGEDPGSPFYGRILASDDPRSATRCISLDNLFKSLSRSELFVTRPKRGPIEYGPLWAGEDGNETRKRTTEVIDFWFDGIRSKAADWWEAGSGDGGGLAMNDGVAACIAVLRAVFEHLDSNGERLTRLSNQELTNRLLPYREALGSYFASLSLEDRKRFRDLRGVQGVTTRRRRCEQAIKAQIPEFQPHGFEDWLELEKRETNKTAKEIVDRIEITLQKTILEELRREYGNDGEEWWLKGVPLKVRTAVSARYEEEAGKRGGREFYLDLIHYQSIIAYNFPLLGPIFGYAPAGQGKEKRTAWIGEINEIRKVVSHSSSGRSVSLEELEKLEQYDRWLEQQISIPTSVQQTGQSESVSDEYEADV